VNVNCAHERDQHDIPQACPATGQNRVHREAQATGASSGAPSRGPGGRHEPIRCADPMNKQRNFPTPAQRLRPVALENQGGQHGEPRGRTGQDCRQIDRTDRASCSHGARIFEGDAATPHELPKYCGQLNARSILAVVITACIDCHPILLWCFTYLPLNCTLPSGA
jgi:hypothetical protein